ncbi:MAG: Lrp/AsnC family transcriptional regulator [Bacteriovoracaceae bacterium]|nr:Lrp/AsnC family transcriptional regulator [Bacteriovoracaceae bacterium]
MIKLTKRDQELLSGLAQYGMFSTKTIIEMYFNGINFSTVLRRLRKLEAENFIRRVGKLETNEFLWGVTSKGGELVGQEFFKTHWSKSMLEHDHKLVGLRLLLENLDLSKSWIPEHQIRSSIYKKYSLRDAKDKLIPDGLMEASVKNYSESLAIELELNLKNKARYKKMIYAYQGKDNLHAVWFIVSSRSILNCLKDYWNKCRSNYSKVRVYFSLLEDIQTLGANAKMIGLETTYIIKNYFDLPAQVSAQSVSTPITNLKILNVGLSPSIHAQMSEVQI